MKPKNIIITIVVSLAFVGFVMPQALGQESMLPSVEQKDVYLTIDSDNNVSVAHQIKNSKYSNQLNFVSGTIENLKFIDKVGLQRPVNIDKDAKYIEILPDQDISFVEYNLKDALILKDGVWTMNYRYLHETIFTLPKEVDLIFVNQRPVSFDKEKKFKCHGCEMTLEYSINEPKNIQNVTWEDKEFSVQINSHSEIENFVFSQENKRISYDINDNKGHYVTTIIPLELLWSPYFVFLDDKKIFFHEYIRNDTHVWVNIKPDKLGEITIMGTSVIPEFPIIIPLMVIGFMMIMLMPWMKKFNLR